MFTRSAYQTPDMQAQHSLLSELAGLIDTGRIRTTVGEHMGAINASHLRQAHTAIETDRTRGKLVLEGF